MEVEFTGSFFRSLKNLPLALQEEVFEKIDLFCEPANHKMLKVHKLKGRLKGRYSFSVNYKTRIVFTYTSNKPKVALLHMVGDHDVYNQ